MYILTLAGGTGTRLWPRSRKATPKQLLSLTGGNTMMQTTINRVLPIAPIEQIFIATNAQYGPTIQDQLPNLADHQIILEPSGKNTAPAIGLGALHIRRQNDEAVMASLHSDHFIADEEGFRQALLAAAEVARQGYLVTLGIQPNRPETGYGYIQRGPELGQYNRHTVYRAARFLEKPDLPTAEKFLASGQYYWNSGIFIWQVSTLFEAFRQYMPEFYRQLNELDQAIAAGQPVGDIWQKVQPCSIDVGIMEKAENVAVVPTDIGWNDVGGWNALYEINQPDENNNVVFGAEHIAIETTGTMVEGNHRLIATIGLEDVVIVDSDDAILICARDRAQDVKQIVQWLKENKRTELL